MSVREGEERSAQQGAGQSSDQLRRLEAVYRMAETVARAASLDEIFDALDAAERDLRRTLRSALESDARRFLDPLAPAGEGPEALRAAADRVLAEAERLIASLGGAPSRG